MEKLNYRFAPVFPWGKQLKGTSEGRLGNRCKMKPGNTSPYCSAWLRIYCGHYVQPAQSHRPCFETSDVLIWSRATELCVLVVGQNHIPGLPSPTRSLVPASYHTYLHSNLKLGEHPAYKQPQDYQKSRQGAKTSPKACLGPNRIHSTNAGGYNKIEEISMIQYLRDQEDTLHWVFARWAGAMSKGSPICS